MEKDDEVHGSTGTGLDFGARLYDPRVGRWLSLDPLAAKYPYLSPYTYTADNPILFVDVNGEDFFIRNVFARYKFKSAMKVMFSKEVCKDVAEAFQFKHGKLSIDLGKIEIDKLSTEQRFALSKLYEVAEDPKTRIETRVRLFGSSETVRTHAVGDADAKYEYDYDIAVNPWHKDVDWKLHDTEGGVLKEGEPDYKPSRPTIWAILFGHELGHATEDRAGNLMGPQVDGVPKDSG